MLLFSCLCTVTDEFPPSSLIGMRPWPRAQGQKPDPLAQTSEFKDYELHPEKAMAKVRGSVVSLCFLSVCLAMS